MRSSSCSLHPGLSQATRACDRVGDDEETDVVAAVVVMMGGVAVSVSFMDVTAVSVLSSRYGILLMKLKRAERRCGMSLSASVVMVCVLPVHSGAGGILSRSKFSAFSFSACASSSLAAASVSVVVSMMGACSRSLCTP